MRVFLFRLGALILGTLLACAAVGLYLYLGPTAVVVSPEDYEALKGRLDYNPRSLFRIDGDLSYMLKPRFEGIRLGTLTEKHQTNSRSLLGTREVPTGDDSQRILFLGDSVTYGDGVPFENIFTHQIQLLAGEGYFIANAGCSGWSTHQEIAFFEKYQADIDWAAVVLVFCVNDLVRFEWVYESDCSFKLSAEMTRNGGLRRISNSAAGLRLRSLVNGFRADPKTYPLADHNTTTLFAFDETKWKTYEEEVLEPALGGHRIPGLIVVTMPSSLQLHALRKGTPPELALYPQRRMGAFCRRQGIPYIDAGGAFEKVPNLDTEFLDDLHLRSGGHRRVAKFLWPAISALMNSD